MKETQKNFFDIMESFRKLNISSMMPLAHGEFAVLKVIQCCARGEKGGCETKVKVSSIVREMRMPPPAISRALRILEQKGLVVRTVDTEDRRNTFVEVTEQGYATIDEVDTIMEDFASAVFDDLGEETMQRLNTYFSRLLEISKTEIEKRKYSNKKGESE